jgi:hypothetical protein
VLVLSKAVLVFLIDLSILRCARLGDTIVREHVDKALRVVVPPRRTKQRNQSINDKCRGVRGRMMA